MNCWNDVILWGGLMRCRRCVSQRQLKNFIILFSSRLPWVHIHFFDVSLYPEDLQLAPYFKECLSAAELDELNIEIIRNTLYKAYLEDFLDFASHLPSPTSTIIEEILFFEADRRAINITVNSFGTDLSKDERAKLYPSMGRLWPAGTMALQRADDVEGVKLACDSVVEYRGFFEQGSGGAAGKSLEDHFFEREAHLNKLAFLQQVNLIPFLISHSFYNAFVYGRD
jgi:vacuolar-type H+-ATPase subunit C/Vma6